MTRVKRYGMAAALAAVMVTAAGSPTAAQERATPLFERLGGVYLANQEPALGGGAGYGVPAGRRRSLLRRGLPDDGAGNGPGESEPLLTECIGST